MPLSAAAFDWYEFLGRLHPLVLHLPIGLFAGLVLLELLSWWSPAAVPARRTLCAAFAASAAFAAFTGWLLSSGEGYSGVLLEDHRRLGLATGAGASMLGFFEVLGSISSRVETLRRVALLACGVLITLTGHQGGIITHGQRFLSEKAPAWLAPLLGPADSEDRGGSPTSGEAPSNAARERPGARTSPSGGVDIAGLVAAFERHCIECHCEAKSKAGLRFDLVEGWLAGADAEDPEMSELLYRVTLPVDDPDAMPPKGERLEPASIAALESWMRAGADPEPIASALESRRPTGVKRR